jgi:hypothetical protein
MSAAPAQVNVLPQSHLSRRESVWRLGRRLSASSVTPGAILLEIATIQSEGEHDGKTQGARAEA